MPLELLPCEEADLQDFVRIQHAAFQSGLVAFLAPQPATEEWLHDTASKYAESMRDEPDCHFLKVVDTELGGRMIAGAKWRINPEGRSEEQLKKMLPVPGEKQEGNPVAQAFMWYLNRMRKQYVGTAPSCGKLMLQRCQVSIKTYN